MSLLAKILAVIVLGILSAASAAVMLVREGVLGGASGEAGAIIIGQMALGVFFSVCGIALAVMVLAAPETRR